MENKTWIGFLTIMQAISTIALVSGWREPSIFSIEHEDTIFIMMLCTYFIVSELNKKKIITIMEKKNVGNT